MSPRVEPPRSPSRDISAILLIWASATIPMGALAWIVCPGLIVRTPLPPGIVFWLLMIVGMAWQFVLSLIVLKVEGRTLSYKALRQRLWLEAPKSPRRSTSSWRMLWWVIPAAFFGLLAAIAMGLSIEATARWRAIADLAPDHARIETLTALPLHGRWWLLGVALASSLFNYFLGESLLFHGVLLPRVVDRFGRWGFAVNALLFGLYHVHKFWMIPSILATAIFYSLPAQYFRSAWLAMLTHAVDGVVLIMIVLWVVLGG